MAIPALTLTSKTRLETLSPDHVFGVTKLNNKLYVLRRSFPTVHCQTSHFIYVFENSDPFRRIDAIQIKEIKHPEDIVSSDIDDCLYVSDSSDIKFIWKIKASDKKITKWLSGVGVENPHTLSVTKDGGLLVLKNERDMSSSNFKIYNRDATLRYTVKLHVNLTDARHVVETSTGNFVICHTGKKEVEPNGRREEGITEVSRDGKTVIRRFYSTCETQRLDNPVYLWIGTNDELFVADQGFGQVILLDSDMNWNGILIPANNMELPWRLHFDEDEIQLLVGQRGSLAGAVVAQYKAE